MSSIETDLDGIRMESIRAINELQKPKLLLILSGKRKSGKDYIEQLLIERYPNKILSFRISAPIKHEFASRNGLNYEELLSSSQYKESFRKQMVEWSESVRKQDPHYFLRLSILDSYRKNNGNERPIWILNDARRPTDLQYFEPNENEINLNNNNCKRLTIRIQSDDSVRTNRGWKFTAGIDDQTTECGLDEFHDWNYRINNNGTKDELIEELSPIFNEINMAINQNIP
ncbi:phosphomevalonate kinase-like protein [Euroglyphus maynei]|uniref:Phosphomevalonate kinase n=1 Tax=Euroglyphus maynei TaxID=6958 RepID=A0A1Y3AV93_EURMA|nr:phosphomevalonate kinase-like protein [Euroglyphus maynei]